MLGNLDIRHTFVDVYLLPSLCSRSAPGNAHANITLHVRVGPPGLHCANPSRPLTDPSVQISRTRFFRVHSQVPAKDGYGVGRAETASAVGSFDSRRVVWGLHGDRGPTSIVSR